MRCGGGRVNIGARVRDASVLDVVPQPQQPQQQHQCSSVQRTQCDRQADGRTRARTHTRRHVLARSFTHLRGRGRQPTTARVPLRPGRRQFVARVCRDKLPEWPPRRAVRWTTAAMPPPPPPCQVTWSTAVTWYCLAMTSLVASRLARALPDQQIGLSTLISTPRWGRKKEPVLFCVRLF